MLLLHSDSVAHPENFKGEVLKKKLDPALRSGSRKLWWGGDEIFN